MKKRRVKTTACILLTAALCSLLFGCEEAAVQTLDVALATPTPTPQVVSFQESDAEASAKYGITVLSPNEGAVQADGTILTKDGEQIRILEMGEPTPTLQITPTPIPTAPPETPTPTPSPTPSPSPTPTEEPEPTEKATKKPSSTPRPTSRATSTPRITNTPTVAPETTFVITPAPTEAPPATPTDTPVQTSAQEPPSVSGPYSGEDVLLAARVAYFESGKSEEGYRAVVCVILNRVEASKWPNSVYDVVYQKSQFSVIGRSDFLTKTIPDSVIGYANDVLNNANRLLPTYVMSFRSATTDKVWGTRTYFGTYGGNDYYG